MLFGLINMKTIRVLFLMSFFTIVTPWKQFHLGRSLGGNLGAPETNKTTLPPEEWFEQTLDHFNPTDGRTWKQVSIQLGYNV